MRRFLLLTKFAFELFILQSIGICVRLYAFALQKNSYLVDPASSHMLVSKIKPCMYKYILTHSETANGSLNQLWFLRS